MATIGPMARYVDDLTLAYNIFCGQDPSSPYTVPTNEARPEMVDIRRLHCALFTDGGGAPVGAEIGAAVERAGMALQKVGAAVDAATPPIERASELWWSYAIADGGQPLNQAMGDRIRLPR
jgi:amidase